MNEIRCARCGRPLNRLLHNGYQIEGYYLYNENAYCADCWDKKQSGVLVFAKNGRLVEGNGKTTWVLIDGVKVRPARGALPES